MASAAWNKRNERARELGYRNEYDRRVHDWGRIPPSQPAATGQRLALLRGHRSYRHALDAVRSGNAEIWALAPTKRNKLGQITGAHVVITMKDGSVGEYNLPKSALTRGKGSIGRDIAEAQRQGTRSRLRGRGSRSFYDAAPPDIQGATGAAIDAGYDFGPADYSAMSGMLARGDEEGVRDYIADVAGFDPWGEDISWDDLIYWLDYYDVDIADRYTGEF